MDATEKVLNNLIDSMHKYIAKGHGDKKLNASKELSKAAEVEEVKEKPEQEEPSLFTKMLQQAKDNKKKSNRVEMTMAIASPKKKSKK